MLWIGGPPSSGKTSIATALARRYGLRLYSADTRTWLHRDRALAMGNAAAHRWESLTPAERWTQSSPAEMFAMSLHRERGEMVVHDVVSLPTRPLIIAEGSVVPAWVVSRGIAAPLQAAWLIPTEEFQDKVLAARHVVGGPADLYRSQRSAIEDEALEAGAPVLPVDGSRDVVAMTAAVERHFAAALAAGPRAGSIEERRALLREINEAIVGQVRGFYVRPWAEGVAGAVTRRFVCECGSPLCADDVQASVAVAAAGAGVRGGPCGVAVLGWRSRSDWKE